MCVLFVCLLKDWACVVCGPAERPLNGCKELMLETGAALYVAQWHALKDWLSVVRDDVSLCKRSLLHRVQRECEVASVVRVSKVRGVHGGPLLCSVVRGRADSQWLALWLAVWGPEAFAL